MRKKMNRYVVGTVAAAAWVTYIMCSHNTPVEDVQAQPVAVSHHNDDSEQHIPFGEMSTAQFDAYVKTDAARDQKKIDAQKPKPVDTTVHYSDSQLTAIAASMGMSYNSPADSAQQTLDSGNAVFTGAADDVQVGAVDPGNVPSGYHYAKAYTTKKGKVVKAHYVKNRASSNTTKSTTSSPNPDGPNLSTPIFTRAHDVQQRSEISHENFPGASISGSDPTVIIGTH
jgi:hypothetical protein